MIWKPWFSTALVKRDSGSGGRKYFLFTSAVPYSFAEQVEEKTGMLFWSWNGQGRERMEEKEKEMQAMGLFKRWDDVCNRKGIKDTPKVYQSEAYGRLEKMEMLLGGWNLCGREAAPCKASSSHPELINLSDFPLQMAYVHKNQEALLVLGQELVCFMLLTKTAAGSDLLEKVQEQTGLAFHVGF